MTLLRIALVGSALIPAADTSRAVELLPYQAPGWKYHQVPWGDPLAATFYSTSFDDSGWSIGQAGFGNFGEVNEPEPSCTAVYTVHTQWDSETDILLRRYFTASSALPVTIYLSIDNDATVYVNGTVVLTVEHAGCPFPDDFSVVVPTSALMPSGFNLLAIKAHDRNLFSFVDARIDGEFPPLGVKASTWGAIKALYR